MLLTKPYYQDLIVYSILILPFIISHHSLLKIEKKIPELSRKFSASTTTQINMAEDVQIG